MVLGINAPSAVWDMVFPPSAQIWKKKIFYCYFVSSLRFFDREKDELNLRMVCLYGKKKSVYGKTRGAEQIVSLMDIPSSPQKKKITSPVRPVCLGASRRHTWERWWRHGRLKLWITNIHGRSAHHSTVSWDSPFITDLFVWTRHVRAKRREEEKNHFWNEQNKSSVILVEPNLRAVSTPKKSLMKVGTIFFH
jgi:hypothetical protein